MNTVNLNMDTKTLEACLKAVHNIGSTKYVNICTDTVHSVPWGTMEWCELLFPISVGIVITILLLIISLKSFKIYE